jgi:hypothetical protein
MAFGFQSTVLKAGYPQIERFFKVTDYCGDRRAVIQSNSFPDTEEVFKVSGFPGDGGCSGLSTVLLARFSER